MTEFGALTEFDRDSGDLSAIGGNRITGLWLLESHLLSVIDGSALRLSHSDRQSDTKILVG